MLMWNRDLRSPAVIVLKGLLFLAAGLLASAAIAIQVFSGHADWTTLFLHGVAVWCFCRAYYFAFYVVQMYIDPAFRFAGLISVVGWLVRPRTPSRRDC